MKKTALTLAYEAELQAASDLMNQGDVDRAFERLEAAHVLGQRHPVERM
jgi:hypothetical protein